MWTYNTAVVLAGTSLLGVCSGLVGCFAVLRRRALTGDALAHAALPGLCVAFLVAGHRSLPLMLLGALVSGLIGIGVIVGLRRTTRLEEDAAIGIVLSVFFGAGVVASGMIQKQTTAGSKAGLESYVFGKTAGMILSDVWLVGGAALACTVLVLLLYKEFSVVSFDADFADVQGWPTSVLDLLLLGMIAVAVVIGLPAVGVVLVAALLILPAAAARFWTDRLDRMLGLSAAFGLSVGALGTLFSARFSMLPAGPIIVLVGSVLFTVSLLFAPERGLVARLLRDRRFRQEVDEDRLLCHLYEAGGHVEAGASIAGWNAARLRATLERLAGSGDVEPSREGSFRWTARGERRAAATARTERLWTRFAMEYPDLVTSYADLDRRSLEEHLPPEVVRELEEQLRAEGRLPEVPDAAGGEP